MKKGVVVVLTGVLVLSLAFTKAVYSAVEGGIIVLSKYSEVTVTFKSSDAGYNNLFGFHSPSPPGPINLFWGHSTLPGTTVNLGQFPKGTELIFFMKSPPGYTYYTGPGSRNPDGKAHAMVENLSFQTWRIGFEDTYGGGDYDFNDMVVEVNGKVVNRPPVANAGPDQTVEQTKYHGANVTLDGSGSSDPDEDPLTYKWTWPGGSATGVKPTVSLPLGATTITLIVNDGKVNSASDMVIVTVRDTTPPVVTCPGDIRVEQKTRNGTVVNYTVTATDICDADVTIVCIPPSGTVFPLGNTTVNCTATDDSGNSSNCSFKVTVVDTTPPVVTCPSDIRVEQKTRNGTVVNYTV
ncbi:MAG: HYR domain-containing protein, partial [bacterium]|nr:HYR domain-containing protein [bacterium]